MRLPSILKQFIDLGIEEAKVEDFINVRFTNLLAGLAALSSILFVFFFHYQAHYLATLIDLLFFTVSLTSIYFNATARFLIARYLLVGMSLIIIVYSIYLFGENAAMHHYLITVCAVTILMLDGWPMWVILSLSVLSYIAADFYYQSGLVPPIVIETNLNLLAIAFSAAFNIVTLVVYKNELKNRKIYPE